MQRYRHQRVGFGGELAAGTGHPLAHGAGKVQAVAIFQGMHEVAGDVVETHGGTGAPIGRRIGDRFHGEDARAGIVGEGNA
jgi:hypothetical protein